eukprot:3921043-Rhodomonas_salina.1
MLTERKFYIAKVHEMLVTLLTSLCKMESGPEDRNTRVLECPQPRQTTLFPCNLSVGDTAMSL